MKRFLHLISAILFLVFLSSSAHAQVIKEFSKDTAQFIPQFQEFVSRNISEQEEDSLKSFIEKWETGFFSEDVKTRFIDVCNLMLENKASRDPFFTK